MYAHEHEQPYRDIAGAKSPVYGDMLDSPVLIVTFISVGR